MKNQRSRVRTGVGIGCAAAASVVLSLLLCFPTVVPSSILPWTPARGRRGRERGRRREVRRGRRGARDRRVGSCVCVDGRGREREDAVRRENAGICGGGGLLFYATASAPRCRALQSPCDAHLLFFPHARRDGGSTGNSLSATTFDFNRLCGCRASTRALRATQPARRLPAMRMRPFQPVGSEAPTFFSLFSSLFST